MREGPEENVSALIVAWYQRHRTDGGLPDSVAETLIAEVLDEDAAGQGFSYQPGQA